jgi:hypothetical protein
MVVTNVPVTGEERAIFMIQREVIGRFRIFPALNRSRVAVMLLFSASDFFRSHLRSYCLLSIRPGPVQ